MSHDAVRVSPWRRRQLKAKAARKLAKLAAGANPVGPAAVKAQLGLMSDPIIEVRPDASGGYRVSVVHLGGGGAVAWHRRAANTRGVRLVLPEAAKVRDRLLKRKFALRKAKS